MNPQTLVCVLGEVYAKKYTQLTYTLHGWTGYNTLSGQVELLPNGAIQLVPLADLLPVLPPLPKVIHAKPKAKRRKSDAPKAV